MSSDPKSPTSDRGEMQERPSSCFYRNRKRRRFLVVPETEKDLSLLKNAYCDYNDKPSDEKFNIDTFASSSRNRLRRPLPSTQILMSTMNETRNDGRQKPTKTRLRSKLLENFYESIGMKGYPDEASDSIEEEGPDKKPAQMAIDEIDDPSRSTMTIGHHRRYLQLTTNSKQSTKRTLVQKKELQKLSKMVWNEQAMYKAAVDKFHNTYKSRYMIGFEDSKSIASAVCRWACFHAQAINKEWEQAMRSQADSTSTKMRPLPKHYGKLRQTLALHNRSQQTSLDVQDLTCSVVHQSTPQPLHPRGTSSLPAKLLEISLQEVRDEASLRKLFPPKMDSAPPVQLLRSDSRAIELAAKHSANIITTAETLETLLQLPGHHSSKWMLPAQSVALPGSKSFATILDLPIAQAYSSPRSCLEKGLQESVYQALYQQFQTKMAESEKKEEITPTVGQFVYSLWKLPTKNAGGANGSRQPTRVLIRTLVRLRDAESKIPVRIRARVEYFSTPMHSKSSRRREIPSSYEKSLWILDQILFGHQVFGLQYRIDPTTCEVVGWDTTSVAHAFAASESNPNVSKKFHHQNNHTTIAGPLDHWKTLIHLLQSIPSIDLHNSVLCLPGLIGEKKKRAQDPLEEGKRGAASPIVPESQTRLDPFSVSVHGSCDDPSASSTSQSTDLPGTICLDKSFLDRAGGVLLNDHAIRDCRREWEWDRNAQVPNTFPVLEGDRADGGTK